MKKYSIAIYGSSLRENFDKYSDKDLLIVADSYNILNMLKNKYEREGFSVSTYTYSKLKYLSQRGSLFVEHLKQESKILTDYENRLQMIYSNHKVIDVSNNEINESKSFFDFLYMIPNQTKGYAWFCDCFYVGFRNYLILNSAKEQDYNFSYLSLIEKLKINKYISNSEYLTLRELRVIKNNYRERISDELPNQDYVQKLLLIANKLELLKNVDFVKKKLFIKEANTILSNKMTNPYYKLRILEIYYQLEGLSIERIEKIITNPKFYTLKFKDNQFVEGLVKEIRKRHTTTNIVHAAII